jgi:hypothetical protein
MNKKIKELEKYEILEIRIFGVFMQIIGMVILWWWFGWAAALGAYLLTFGKIIEFKYTKKQ